MPVAQTRRHFLTSLSLAGAAGLLGARRSPAAEEVLETTSVRLLKGTPICAAPVYLAEDLLRAEGFTDIRYVETKASGAVGRREIDFISGFALQQIKAIDASEPMTVLAGVHVGCFELFAQETSAALSS
jgi:NitT/TauT family transport system substrate-binding protein